jgi:hypothetical protein
MMEERKKPTQEQLAQANELHGKVFAALKPLAQESPVDVYRACCNVIWVPFDHPAQAYKDVDFSNPDSYIGTWSCSWRYAGGLVADMREQGENYLDFYCSGYESTVTEQVRVAMESIGLRPVK